MQESARENGQPAAKDSSPVKSTSACEDGLVWSGRFAGGIQDDIARRLPWYTSDWVDCYHGGLKTFTASLYMFFGCLAPGIAFGAYFDQFSGGQTGVVEYLITQSVAGIIFAVISGQPLVILRPTGPITVFISQLYGISKALDVPYLTVQAWTGIFVGSYMVDQTARSYFLKFNTVIIAVCDGCAAIRYCSRFTQDLFGFFVSCIFVSLGIGNIVDKFTNKQDEYDALHQFLLTMATLYFAFTLASFNKARFFNSKVRDTIADFAVPLAVATFTIAANLMTVPLEPLPVPSKFEPTQATRSWFVDLCPADSCGSAVLIGAAAAIPLVFLFFIDQNVTMLLTQHPDHDLKKGGAFHYNFLLLGLFNMTFPLFGCPYVTGSLPHSPQFVRALAKVEVVRENGYERTKIVRVYENRVAPLLVNVLILISLPIIGELSRIPTAVICDGLFLYMGLSGLPGNQLFERIKLVFTDPTLYPPLHFSETEVPRFKMHVFTLLQALVVVVLFGVSRSPIALAFPVFLVASIPFRMMLPKLTGGFISAEVVAILDHAKKQDKEPPMEPPVEPVPPTTSGKPWIDEETEPPATSCKPWIDEEKEPPATSSQLWFDDPENPDKSKNKKQTVDTMTSVHPDSSACARPSPPHAHLRTQGFVLGRALGCGTCCGPWQTSTSVP